MQWVNISRVPLRTLPPSLSLSHTHTHTHKRSLSRAHTHTHTHIYRKNPITHQKPFHLRSDYFFLLSPFLFHTDGRSRCVRQESLRLESAPCEIHSQIELAQTVFLGPLQKHPQLEAETAAVSCGTSPCQRCTYTTSVDNYSKTRAKKLVTHVESHASAVSLLESAE